MQSEIRNLKSKISPQITRITRKNFSQKNLLNLRNLWTPSGRRGSVLVMVIGLLVIVAMLGSMLLLLSRLDRQQTQAMGRYASAEPVAQGIVGQLKALLLEDLHIDPANGPYGVPTTQPADYADYAHASYNAWLSRETTPAYLSDVFGTSNQIDVNPPIGQPDTVDTDGDGASDAYICHTGVYNDQGQEYYAAVKVIDLSGLICVNTGADPTAAGLPLYVTPVHVDLRTLIGATLYDGGTSNPGLHRTRCGKLTGSGPWWLLNNFYTRCAMRLYNPNNSPPTYTYLPFSIGDELFLRWRAANSPANIGRLYNVLSPLSAANRANLTTFNCTRSLVRVPEGFVSGQAPEWHTPIYLSNTVFNNPVPPNPYSAQNDPKQRLYRTLVDALYGGSGAPNVDKQRAAHFVANLWAYLDGRQIDDDEPYAFTPTGSGTSPTYAIPSFTAYGLKQGPILSEVFGYYRHMKTLSPPSNDQIYGYAIEIWNPPGNPAVNLAQYRLTGFGGSPINLPSYSLGQGLRVVLYNCNASPGPDRTAVGFPEPYPANWVSVTGIDFGGTVAGTIQLQRVYPGGVYVPVDEFTTGTGHDFEFTLPTVASGIERRDIRRDDDATRARYNVRAYLTMASPDAANLGNANGLDGTDMDGNPSGEPNIYQGLLIFRRGASMRSVEESLRMYLTGPSLDASTTTYTSFSENLVAHSYADDVSRGRLDLVDATGAPGTGCVSTTYPTVPQACILGELVTLLEPDQYRSDDSSLRARVYGRININTATEEVLRRLPWPTNVGGVTINNNPGNPAQDEVGAIIGYILGYRDRLLVGSPLAYQVDRNGDTQYTGSVDIDLQHQSAAGGFQTPGEIAIPLAEYTIDKNLTGTVGSANYLTNRDALYSAIANLITVNSDTYAAYIYVQIPHDPNKAGTAPEGEWRYLAVIDRSNCRQAGATGDQPAVLMFTPIR